MHRKLITCALVLLSLLLTAVQYMQCTVLRPVIRQTKNGPVEGAEITSPFQSTRAYVFASIPYANPPITGRDPYTGEVVDRRFKTPEPLSRHWIKPIKVAMYGNQCIQGAKIQHEDEDCLFLSVYVPADGAKWKTVLVYFHGGNFAYGGGPLGVDFLLAQDNIVVNIQSRLGIFGYLNLDYGEYTGNMGMKDQQLALKWVYENIENFSGKKDEIMIFGLSSGATAVHLHMLNEESRKYFNRAFAVSNTAFSGLGISRKNHVDHLQKCSQLKEMNDLIKHIKTSNFTVLRECYASKFPGELFTYWTPTIEIPIAVRAFMTKTPNEIYNSDKAPVMDAMFNFATQEALAFYPELFEITEPLLKDDWTQYDGTIFTLPYEGATRYTHPNEYKYAIEKLRAAYYPNTTTIEAIRRANIDLMSDSWNNDGILKATVLQAKANTKHPDRNQHKNTFLFRFSVHTELKNMLKEREYTGATHADILPYIFLMQNNLKIYNEHLKKKDHIYYQIMRTVKMISNFARTGDPSIDSNMKFELSRSEYEIYCNDVSNLGKTRKMRGIKETLHYNVWRDIEDVMNHKNHTKINSKKSGTGNKADRLSQGLLLNICIILGYLYMYTS